MTSLTIESNEVNSRLKVILRHIISRVESIGVLFTKTIIVKSGNCLVCAFSFACL